MLQQIELGLDILGDITTGGEGKLLSHAQVIRNVMEEVVLADELNIDFFGEHHHGYSRPSLILVYKLALDMPLTTKVPA